MENIEFRVPIRVLARNPDKIVVPCNLQLGLVRIKTTGWLELGDIKKPPSIHPEVMRHFDEHTEHYNTEFRLDDGRLLFCYPSWYIQRVKDLEDRQPRAVRLTKKFFDIQGYKAEVDYKKEQLILRSTRDVQDDFRAEWGAARPI